MANFTIDAVKAATYDAIVIGSGISGGWAAKELCEKGLRTLVLERGRDVKHVKDYPTANLNPWDFEHRGQVPLATRAEYGKARSFMREETLHWAIKESEQPYIEDKPFTWTRGYHVGGKSLLWARQTQRWSDFDFEGPARDGFAVDWPIRYNDIAPWYSYVEKFAGISGNKDGLPHLPDGEFLPAIEMNCVETHFQNVIAKNYTDRHLIQGRCAHITSPQPIHTAQGRAKCQHRALCVRGCPYGGYFSSNASTLPWAEKTGRMTLRPHSVVHSIIYDEKKGRATGVRVVDANTKQMLEFYARIIFVNGSALNSNLILMNSTSSRFPNGLANDSGLLGKYIAWHNYRGRMSAEFDGFPDRATDGKNPTHSYFPRFRNLHKQEMDFLRGYAVGFGAGRGMYATQEGIGAGLKEQLLNRKWGNWGVSAWMMGETIPKETSFLALDKEQKDPYGIPTLRISADWDDNDERMIRDYLEQFTEMFTKAGFTNIKATDSKAAPGSDIHEMGGVRMGKDPKTSLLNEWNQLHHCKNVFVTDGACMTSTSTQNPSLTYMALTARAADYAVKELKKKNL
ncbi:choline dehydrogenase-like flavoprotein [Larkinella arboricola]|uniref:Choline dehydrogenase-like flavoprotein n=1 Tax=Larkinella arboricola TaxID=643671 RepID=A0A327X804_LARAB|nr:GMC family oxidoreductase [Larkinella arboricola]RAK02348.1 choline dehydrogenase-like flavoprotein [Larkinella arboricola]